MPENLHTILRQSYEVDFPSEEKAQDFQVKFADLVKGKLARVIESVFDSYNLDKSILRINRLEIDLGSVNINNLESELPVKLEREIRRLIDRKILQVKDAPDSQDGDKIITVSKSLIEVFSFYLDTGTLPWWGRYVRENNISISQVFETLLKSSTQEVAKAVKIKLRDKSVRDRFVRQFDDKLLKLFFQEVYTYNASALEESINSVTILFKELNSSTPKVTNLPIRQVIWYHLIEEYIVPSNPPHFDKAKFNDKLVDYIIKSPDVRRQYLKRKFQQVDLPSDVLKAEVFPLVRQALTGIPASTTSLKTNTVKLESFAPKELKDWINRWYKDISREQLRVLLKRVISGHEEYVIKLLQTTEDALKSSEYFKGQKQGIGRLLFETAIEHIYIHQGKQLDRQKLASTIIKRVSEKIQEPENRVENLLRKAEVELPEEISTSKQRALSDIQTLRFFLLLGVLPANSSLTTLEEIMEVASEISETQLRDLFKNIDPLILPVMARRVRMQFSETLVERIFNLVPELKLAEIVDESFNKPLIFTIQQLNESEQGLFYKYSQLKETDFSIEDIIQLRSDDVEEASNFDEVVFDEKRKDIAYTFLSKGFFASEEAEEVSRLNAAQQRKLHQSIYHAFNSDREKVIELVKESLKKPDVRQQLIKYLPDSVLFNIAQAVRPNEIQQLTSWVDLYTARTVKERGYRMVFTELRQKQWELMFTASMEDVMNMIQEQNIVQEEPAGLEAFTDEVQDPDKAEQSKEEEISQEDSTAQESPAQDSTAEESPAEESRDEESGMEEDSKEDSPATEPVEYDEEKLAEEYKKKEERWKKEEEERQEKLQKRLGREPIYINNAGLVLFYPYLSRLFKMLDLVEGKSFKDKESAHKAVYILQYIAYKDDKSQEFELALNKILCGLEIFEPLSKPYELTDKEKEICESLVNGIIQNWPSLGSTSADNFRVSFVHREGKLEIAMNGSWQLTVEERAWDVLMDTLPWSINLILMVWMRRGIEVKWH